MFSLKLNADGSMGPGSGWWPDQDFCYICSADEARAEAGYQTYAINPSSGGEQGECYLCASDAEIKADEIWQLEYETYDVRSVRGPQKTEEIRDANALAAQMYSAADPAATTPCTRPGNCGSSESNADGTLMPIRSFGVKLSLPFQSIIKLTGADLVSDTVTFADEKIRHTSLMPIVPGFVDAKFDFELDFKVELDWAVSAGAGAFGDAIGVLTIDWSGASITLDVVSSDPFSFDKGSMSAKLSVKGTFQFNTALTVEFHIKVMPSLCFFGILCIGIAGEAWVEAAAGTDFAVVSTAADGCTPYALNTRMTSYAEYTSTQVAKYTNAASGNAFVLAGGAWMYATFPYVKVYPQLTSQGGMICSTNFPPLFEFKASLGDGPSATNNLDGPEHLYGGYLVRMGETFAYGVGAGKEYDPITGKVLPGITLFSF
jgi:hypothetical protein